VCWQISGEHMQACIKSPHYGRCGERGSACRCGHEQTLVDKTDHGCRTAEMNVGRGLSALNLVDCDDTRQVNGAEHAGSRGKVHGSIESRRVAYLDQFLCPEVHLGVLSEEKRGRVTNRRQPHGAGNAGARARQAAARIL
jgi:hypothetical protein